MDPQKGNISMKPISSYFELLDEQIQLPIEGINHPVILKYIGYLQSQPTLYCGFDILEPDMGKNNGSYNGVKYFDTKFTNSGLFIPLYKINEELNAALMNKPKTVLQNKNIEEMNKLYTEVNQQKMQLDLLKTEKENLVEVIDKNQTLINEFENMMNLVEPKLSDCLARIKMLEDRNKELLDENHDLKAQIRHNVDSEFKAEESDFDMDYKENLTPVKLKSEYKLIN